jgi:hypothetical protein
MDKLDQEIAAKRATINKLRLELRAAEIELAAFERAAQLRPGAASTVSARGGFGQFGETIYRKGRQPGAISQEWRRLLELVVQRHGAVASSDLMAELGPEAGIPNLNANLVRQRMTLYLQRGYVEAAGGDTFCVTDHAMTRFNLRKPKTADEFFCSIETSPDADSDKST